MAGRPKKFKTVEDMQKAIDKYLNGQRAIEKQPSIQGLCLSLGFTARQSLINYTKRNEEFKPLIDNAKDLIYKQSSNHRRRKARVSDELRKSFKHGQGYVYLIHCKGTIFYKIGISKNDPENRLSSLQSGCPFELEMIHLGHCDYYGLLESELHSRYSKYKVRGEWFEFSDSQVLCVKNDIESQINKQLKLF